MAFHSEWNRPADNAKTRQVIVLFTDASAHPLDDPKRTDPEFNSHYPEGMPESLEELQNTYSDPNVFPADNNGVVRGHRLILFAPENMYPWTDVKNWQPCVCKSMDPEKGLEELDMDSVYRLIAGSMD